MNNVKLIKPSPLLGEIVPPTANGAAGNYLHELLGKKYKHPVNKGAGADYVSLRVEVKSRDVDATSPVTIGRMSAGNIINTEYQKSHLREKTQNIRFIKHRDQVVVEDYVLNTDKFLIQQDLENIYNLLRDRLRAGLRQVYVTMPNGFFQWETKDFDIYELRIKGSKLRAFEQAAKSTIDQYFQFTN